MTGLLASVNTLEEAITVVEAGVDIIDLKQPEQGALGALETTQVESIVDRIAGKKPTSATIGDLPMQPELVYKAVTNMAKTGVDYIKIGLFPGGDIDATITKLKALTLKNSALIAVFFADAQPDYKLIATVAEAGFTGIMLDTMDKNKGSLTTLLANEQLQQFITEANQYNLLCGLAGSLQASDIPQLIQFKPDYLGFRGALCANKSRTAALDKTAVLHIKQQLQAQLFALC